MLKKIIIFILFIILKHNVIANEPDELHLNIKNITYNNQQLKFDILLNIKDGWKLYSNQDSDFGIPLNLKLLKSNLYTLSSNIEYPPSISEAKIINGKKFISNFYKNYTLIKISTYIDNIDDLNKLYLKLKYSLCNNTCIYKTETIYLKDYLPSNLDQAGNKTNFQQILFYIVVSLIGGLILNFMPCVISIMSLKIISFVKLRNTSNQTVKINIIYYILGIISFYILLAIITIILKHIGLKIGWGAQFQNPYFIMSLILILLIMANNLWGNFEIQLPHRFLTKISNLKINRELFSNYFNGLFIAVLSTSCTAPFLSTAITYSLTQKNIYILIKYFFIAVGMSTPYILILISPNLLKFIPKPGKWVLKFKKFLAIIFILNVIWLLYVLNNQIKFTSLMIFIGFIIILKKISISLFKSLNKFNSKLIIITLTFISFSFFINLIVNHDKNIKNDELIIKDKWHVFNYALIKNEVANNNIVFVQVTADWCATCKINELLVLDNTYIYKIFEKNNVKLFKADYTLKNDDIYKYLKSHSRFGIPVYIIYGPKNKKGLILSEILTFNKIRIAINAVK